MKTGGGGWRVRGGRRDAKRGARSRDADRSGGERVCGEWGVLIGECCSNGPTTISLPSDAATSRQRRALECYSNKSRPIVVFLCCLHF